MLKVTNGLVLQGKLDKWTSFDTQIIQESKDIVSIVLDCGLNDFDKQAQEVIEELAKEGIQYGEKFIISRVKRS